MVRPSVASGSDNAVRTGPGCRTEPGPSGRMCRFRPVPGARVVSPAGVGDHGGPVLKGETDR